MRKQHSVIPMTTQPALFMELTTIPDLTVDQLRFRTNSERLRESGPMRMDKHDHQVMAATALNQIIHALAGEVGATPFLRQQAQNEMVSKCETGDFEGLMEIAGINVEAFLDQVRRNSRLVQARKELLLRAVENNRDLDEAGRKAAFDEILKNPDFVDSPRHALISFAKIVSTRLKSITQSDKSFHQIIGILAGSFDGAAKDKLARQTDMALKCLENDLPKDMLLASTSVEKFVQQALRQAPLLQKETDSVIAHAKVVWARLKSVQSEEED